MVPSRSTRADAVGHPTAAGRSPFRTSWTWRVRSVACAVLVAFVSACSGDVPDGLGVTRGTLAPCPGTPNCVHTGLGHPDGTKPIFLAGRIPADELIPRLIEVVESMPRTTIVERSDLYLRAEVRSLIFRFVDDLELYVTPDLELVVRSASRVGQGDMGVNAERVEELRSRLQAEGLLN